MYYPSADLASLMKGIEYCSMMIANKLPCMYDSTTLLYSVLAVALLTHRYNLNDFGDINQTL